MLKLGPLKGTVSSTGVGLPISTSKLTGSIIDSAILQVSFLLIDEGKGSNVFIKSSYLLVLVFNKALIPVMFIPSPKFKTKSLK